MKKRFLTLALVLSLLVALVIPASVAMAADFGEVECTVTGSIISVSITSDGDVNYGVLALGATQDTVTLVDTQTALNDGTVAAKFQIKSSDAAGVTPWTLAATTGAVDEFTHKASLDDGGTWPIVMTDSATYYDLVATVAAGASETFDLEFGMPSSVTEYGAHTITVTILAIAP